MARAPSTQRAACGAALNALRRLQGMAGRITPAEYQQMRNILLTQVHATLNAIEASLVEVA